MRTVERVAEDSGWFPRERRLERVDDEVHVRRYVAGDAIAVGRAVFVFGIVY